MPRNRRPTSARSTAIATGVITTGATVIITGRTITATATMPHVVRTATTADLAIMVADPASASASAAAAIAAGCLAGLTDEGSRARRGLLSFWAGSVKLSTNTVAP